MKKYFILTFAFLFVGIFSFGQVTKSNLTPGTVNGSQTTRIINFSSGDLGGCTSLTDVDFSIDWEGGAFQVVEQIAVSVQSPMGTTVHVVYDTQGTLTGNIAQFATYYHSGFGSWSRLITTYDDDAGAVIPGDPSVPQAGSWLPEEALSAFDGEDATGNWTITISDHTDNAFGDLLNFYQVDLTISCAAACTDPATPTITASANPICPGASTTLDWSGTSAGDATNWHIYTSSCGVGQVAMLPIGTTSYNTGALGSSTTFYIRGEDGAGCIDESSLGCGSIAITVQDITNPTITCPANQIGIVNGACNFTIPDYTSLAVVADNCTASPTVTQSPVAGTVVGTGTTVITLTATDASSNTANCNFNVTVSDITPPTITCPGNQTGNVGASCTFNLPDYTALATPSDNCPGVTVTQSPAPGTNVGVGTTVITLTATDGASNSTNCNFNVVVSDVTNPTISCPGNQVASVGAACTYNLPDYTGLATPADNCPGVTVTQSPLPGTNVGVGTTVITLTATDGASNTANCNFNVVVSDNTNPTITCPGNQVGIVDGSCNFTIPDYTALSTPSDNCPGVVVTQVPVPGTIVGVGTTNIVLTATDGASNTSNCNFDVVVSDITPPTITCPGNQTGNVGAACTFNLPDYTALATASDNCPGVTVTQSPAPGTNVGTGTTVVTLTATDGSSNSTNCNFNVVVSDVTNPTISCPGNQVASVNASCFYSLPDYTGLSTPADNCPGVVVTQSPAPGTLVGIGTTVITLTATDGASNTANCNFNVVISDNTPPTITCPGDQNETVNASCQFILPDYTGLATTSDNCAASPTVTQSPAPGTTITGATVVTLTSDDGNGNTANCNFNSIGIDVVTPTAVCQNINVYLDGAGNATIVAADVDGGSTDNCTIASMSASQTAFTCADLGPNNVTLTVTDLSSNSDNCVAVVTVLDTISPVTTCPGNQLETPDAFCNFTLPDYTSLVTASDNCNPSPTVTQSPVAGTVISGTTTLTMTSDDGNGNTSTCTFDIILNDATPPTMVCQNINAYLDGAGNVTIAAADLDGGSTDNCAGLTFTASQTAFTCADLGPNNVTLTGTDGNANSANCVAVVTIIDTISPVTTCPGNQVEIAGALCDFVLPDYTGLVTATDNCSGSPVVTQSPVAGTTITADQTITMTSDDGNGNTSTCTFDVNLDVTACAGVECSNAIALAPMDPCGDIQNVTGSTVGGTPQTEGTCGTSAGSGGATWYTFTGDGGDWTASTVSAGTNYDTKLWIFEGACGALNCITGNDDFVGVQSQVTFATTAGLTYYVIVGGFSSSEGTYDMTISNVETEAPVADVPVLADINGVCEITSLTDPTATDNCSAVTVTNDALLPITTNTTITWTYTDADGNFSTQTQEVVLTDLVAPTASNPLDLNVECAGDAPIDVTVVTDEADNCSGAITVTHVSDVLSGNGCQDTITRTYNVADGSGNNIDVVQMIYIEDMTAPTASNPLDLNVQCIGDVPAPATGWVTDEADNCGTPTVTWTSDVSDGQSCPETITRTFTVTDNCGNSVDVVQMVIVMDVDPPLFDIASLPELTGNCDITPATATATDNCDGAMNGTPDVTFPITALGTTTVTWTFVDACGNTDSQTQDVTITAIDVTTSMAPDNITIQANNQGQTYQWIDCVSGLPVAGATNFNFTPSYGSNFAVIITENGCSDTSACVNSTVGIDDLQLKSIVLYPNPTSGIFNVQFEGEIKNIEVLDMLGRVVSLDIDLTNGVVDATRLESGKYMIRLTSGNDQIFVEEFVIQK